MEVIRVVAGIIEKENKILLARRRHGKILAGYWEFPGGKIEVGETEPECLVRELFEELSIFVKVEEHIGVSVYDYDGKRINLAAYAVSYLDGAIQLRDHDATAWVDFSEVLSYELAPADVPLVEMYGNKRANK